MLSVTGIKDKWKYMEKDLTAEDIKNLREDRHWTKTEFAQIMGVSRMTVFHWENGTFTPSGESQVRLKHYLLDIEPEEPFINTRRKEKGSLLDEMDKLERNLKDARISSDTEYGRIPETVRKEAAAIVSSLKRMIISGIEASKQ